MIPGIFKFRMATKSTEGAKAGAEWSGAGGVVAGSLDCAFVSLRNDVERHGREVRPYKDEGRRAGGARGEGVLVGRVSS